MPGEGQKKKKLPEIEVSITAVRLQKLQQTTFLRPHAGTILHWLSWPSPWCNWCLPFAVLCCVSERGFGLPFRAAFGKESEVLIGNLGDKLIPQQEILRDVSDLKALANMHESLEWLAGRTKAALSNLSATQSKYLSSENLCLRNGNRHKYAILAGVGIFCSWFQSGFMPEGSGKQSSSISFFLVWHLLHIPAVVDTRWGCQEHPFYISSEGSFNAWAFQQSLLMTLYRSRYQCQDRFHFL